MNGHTEPGDEPQPASEFPTLADESGKPADPGSDPAATDGSTLSDPADFTLDLTPRPLPTIAGYDIIGELGRGAMGVVYLARQCRLNRPCAVKMILAGAHADPVAMARFLSEAQAAARLRHPNVVQIHAIGESDGLPYFEMEFVESGSLDQKLDGTPWPPAKAAAMIECLARAVAHAHAQGLVHRDIKPANILLTPDGTPKITDFGLVKSLHAKTGLTGSEAVLGSPSYMAPEQAEGKNREVGPSADIHSLGAILYELITGRPPFKALTVLRTLELVKSAEPVPPTRLVPGIARDLETIILVCLRKEPARRFADAAALADDLRRFLDNHPIHARRSSSFRRGLRWCRRNRQLAAALGLIAVLMSALTVGSVVGMIWLRTQRNEALDERLRADWAEHVTQLRRVEALLSAAPESVPYVIETLRPGHPNITSVLQQRFHSSTSSPIARLRAAVALAVLGKSDSGFIIDAITGAPDSEGENLCLALQAVGPSCAGPLRKRFDAETDIEARARLAAGLLAVGDTNAARSMLAIDENPTDRTLFIHVFRTWHGALGPLVAILGSERDAAFRSGVLAAIGRIDPADLDDAERLVVAPVLSELYESAEDGPSHSAAGWAARRWKLALPTITPATASPAGRHWFINRQGLTMIEVPASDIPSADAGSKANWARITHPYFISDREVSVAAFRRFIVDPESEASAKPRGWEGPDRAITTSEEGPVDRVSWVDAILFCNWVSRREGRRPCYVRRGNFWDIDFSANGYRLPTDAEWEAAHRAGSRTPYPIGDRPEYLPDYAALLTNHTETCGGRLPNGHGLFDTMGSLWEWCCESSSVTPDPARVLINPVGPLEGPVRVLRGGAFDAGTFHLRLPTRHASRSDDRSYSAGFRVVCGVGDVAP